jgi:hypothetical protein
MKDVLERRSRRPAGPVPARTAVFLRNEPRRVQGERAAAPDLPYRFADVPILAPGIPPEEWDEETEGADVGLPEGQATEDVRPPPAAEPLGPDQCAPASMKAIVSGKFEGGFSMDDYYDDLKGQDYWAHGDTGGPFTTPRYVGSNAQLIGVVPPSCNPRTFHLEQTRQDTRNRVNGRTDDNEGAVQDDLARSGRNASTRPFRRDWQDSQGWHISMADPPSQRRDKANVELDRTFVTSLAGSAGTASVTWKTSIRIANGVVTRNTISG